MTYRLAGSPGYERVRASGERHIAPGADTIRELFGGQPISAGSPRVDVVFWLWQCHKMNHGWREGRR